MNLDVKKLRDDREWSQAQMADYLGCDQSTVSRMEKGVPPSGPIQRLLERLVADAAESSPTHANGEAA